MTEPKQFKRGRRTYTRMGNFKEVRVDTGTKPAAGQSQTKELQVEIPPQYQDGAYCNTAVVHHSKEEVIVDFAFQAPGASKARVQSRVVMPAKLAKSVGELLGKVGGA